MSGDQTSDKTGTRPAASVLEAVHDDDLDQFLDDLGELGRFRRGEAKCSFCRDVVGRENLYAIFPDSGEVKYACDRPACVVELLEQAGDPDRG